MTTAAIIDDLAWRGLIAQSTDIDALRRDLAAGPMTLYAGFDPTADSLHVGHLMPLLLLRRFQQHGHRPIALVGGATGFIGDPSGRSTERSFSTAATIRANVVALERQLARFLDFDPATAVGALMADNLDWTEKLSILDFLRQVGPHFPLSQMLQRDAVKNRLDAGELSMTEFSYGLLQANDFLELYKRHDCRLQIGGSDQWGNITAGLDFIRRAAGGTAHALTVPLVTNASGEKFGKSTGGGSLWLDPARTPPADLHAYFLATDDRDVFTHLRALTFVGRDELAELETAAAARPDERLAQRRLADALVELVHGA